MRHQKFDEATSVLFRMAELIGYEDTCIFIQILFSFYKCSDGITLEHRIEYLSLALSNAKCCEPSIQSGQIVSNLEEKLDVAKVQLEIRNEINDLDIAAELNNTLLNLTEV